MGGFSDIYNVKTVYGAKGNGTTNDTAAVQSALTACDASTYGGIVYAPPGRYKITNELIYGLKTTIVGAGIGASQFWWPNDLGAGQYALRASTPEQSQRQWHSVHNLGVIGNGNAVVGTDTWGMSGYHCPSRVEMTHVYISGFHGGIALDNDHQKFYDCTFTGNTYNVDYITPIGTGNQTFVNCDMAGASKASVHVDGRNTIGGCVFIGGHVGYAPYGFLRTDKATGGAADNTFMFDTTMASLTWEEIGNAAIYDAQTGSADGLKGVHIFNPGFSWSDSALYYWPGQSYDWCIYSPHANADVEIWSGAYPFTTATAGGGRPGPGLGIVHAGDPGAPTGVTLHGVLGDGPCGSWVQTDSRGLWQQALGTIEEGDLLEWADGAHVQRYGTSTNAYAGIAGSAAASGQVLLYRGDDFMAPLFEACALTIGAEVGPDATVKHHANAGGAPAIAVARHNVALAAGQRWGVYGKLA